MSRDSESTQKCFNNIKDCLSTIHYDLNPPLGAAKASLTDTDSTLSRDFIQLWELFRSTNDPTDITAENAAKLHRVINKFPNNIIMTRTNETVTIACKSRTSSEQKVAEDLLNKITAIRMSVAPLMEMLGKTGEYQVELAKLKQLTSGHSTAP